MDIKFIRWSGKLVVMWALLFVIIFAFTSCTCGGNSTDGEEDDSNDDTYDDDNDDTDDDDDAEGWHIYTIDYKGRGPSAIVDSNGKVHIAYYADDRDLMYATNKSGAWELTNVERENAGQVGYYVHIDLDSKNKAHISYYDPYTRLKYATNSLGSWQIFVVKDGLTSGEDGNNDIGVDSDGKVHIVFFNCGGLNDYDECKVGELKYATNKSGSWQISTIDGGGEFEAGRWYLSMAMDSNDKIHVSYYRCSSCATMGGASELWYATNLTGSWQKTEVGDDVFGDFFGGYNSIALDSSGKVHISFYDKSENLVYATNKSGAWEIFTVDSSKKAGLTNSIAVDLGGYVHISYYDYANDDLKYATNKSGTWQTLVIDSSLTGGSLGGVGMSIAVDSEGYVHIAYGTGGFESKLKYATNRPPE